MAETYSLLCKAALMKRSSKSSDVLFQQALEHSVKLSLRILHLTYGLVVYLVLKLVRTVQALTVYQSFTLLLAGIMKRLIEICDRCVKLN